MATSIDTLQDTAASVADRVKNSARSATDFAREASHLKARAADVLEDGLHDARRTLKRGMHELEDLRDEAVVHVRKKPLAAMGATFLAGLTLGMALGWTAKAAPEPPPRRRGR